MVRGLPKASRSAERPVAPTAHEDAADATPQQEQEPFQAAAEFTGSREGYVFKMAGEGLGYYLDVPLEGGGEGNERRHSNGSSGSSGSDGFGGGAAGARKGRPGQEGGDAVVRESASMRRKEALFKDMIAEETRPTALQDKLRSRSESPDAPSPLYCLRPRTRAACMAVQRTLKMIKRGRSKKKKSADGHICLRCMCWVLQHTGGCPPRPRGQSRSISPTSAR